MFDGQKGCVHYDAQHDEQVEDSIVDYYVQKVLKLEPDAVVDTTIMTLVAVTVHHLIFYKEENLVGYTVTFTHELITTYSNHN